MKKTLLAVLLCVATVTAQSTYRFLQMDISPRAAALAGSYVANGDDPNVVFYNPAGTNLLQGIPVSFSFFKHVADINTASIVASKEFTGIGRFTSAIQYVGYGSFIKADEFGNNLGSFSANDFAFSVAYGNMLDSNFYYGATAKFIYSAIGEISSSGVAFDIGLHYAIPESNWNFGFSILNLGSQLSSYFDTKEDLPVDIRLGFSKQLEKFPLKFYWSFNRLSDRYENFFERFKQITFGAEFKLGQNMKLRIGYDNEKRKEYKLGSSSQLAGFSLGLGFNIKGYVVDYSFSSLGSVGALHRFGLSTSF